MDTSFCTLSQGSQYNLENIKDYTKTLKRLAV